jgi:hypothetical protein
LYRTKLDNFIVEAECWKCNFLWLAPQTVSQGAEILQDYYSLQSLHAHKLSPEVRLWTVLICHGLNPGYRQIWLYFSHNCNVPCLLGINSWQTVKALQHDKNKNVLMD